MAVTSTRNVIGEGDVVYTVEVIRKHIVPVDVTKGASVIEKVKPGGTIVNVGAGPDFPDNPYEGMIWIKT